MKVIVWLNNTGLKWSIKLLNFMNPDGPLVIYFVN